MPWLGFFDKLSQCDVMVLLDSVQFRKRYFQNRNRIRVRDGAAWLTVPVFTAHRSEQAIHDVRIRRDRPWQRKHCETLRRHYARAPFFSEYFPALGALYDEA